MIAKVEVRFTKDHGKNKKGSTKKVSPNWARWAKRQGVVSVVVKPATDSK